MFIYEHYLSDSHTKVIINDDSYIIEQGHDRIILPRSIYEKKKTLPNPQAVDQHISKGFEVLDKDKSVTEFGMTKRLDDRRPLAFIPREDFAILSRPTGVVVSPEDPRNRYDDKPEKLIVLRAILARSKIKWQFVWNGIKIPAAILDEEFYDKLARHEYEFGQGDILDVLLRIYQHRDDDTGIYINTGVYEVIRVYGRSAGARPPEQEYLFPSH